MLKGEWDKWWITLPALEARESLNLYRVLFVADAGWKLDDREKYVREWQDRAEEAQHLRIDGDVPEAESADISHEIRRLFGWMRSRWGSASGRGDPGESGFSGE